MSEELQKEITTLKDQIKGVQAQLNASKQMFNETLEVNLNLRTNIILYQQAHQESLDKNKTLMDSVSTLSNEILELKAKIKELTPETTVAA